MKLTAITIPYRIVMHNQRALTVFFGMVSLLFIGIYMYGVIGTTIAITARRDLEREVRIANTRISELEITYFNTISSITIERAKELGFHEVKDVAFAYSNTTSAVALVR